MRSVEERVDEILSYLSSYDNYVGENVTQMEHALQAGKLASDAGADRDTILGALLHDIGHVVGIGLPVMGMCGVMNHEHVGAQYLSDIGLPCKTVDLVRRHVDAKRYLTATKKAYYDKLTDASKTTLGYQGGPMTNDEVASFNVDPLKETIIKLRDWDDKAKVVGWVVPGPEHYKPMLMEAILSTM